MMKYYFISYEFRGKGRSFPVMMNTLIDYHPLEWRKNAGSYVNSHVLVSWNEITEEEYNQYKGEFE